MPNPDLICEVRANGGVFRDWLTVEASQSVDQSWMRRFTLTCAEPDSPGSKRKTASGQSWASAAKSVSDVLVPGTRVDITLAGQPFITQGLIGTRQAAYDANRHGVQITGFSKAEITNIASADAGTGQFRGYTVEAIANRLLKPYGLKFRVESGPPGWDTPFPNVVIRHGETAFSAISRLCRQRGMWFWTDPKGDLVAGIGQQEAAGIVFEEGVNILSANCSLQWQGAETAIMDSQQWGSDHLSGRQAAEISAQSKFGGGDPMPGTFRRVLAEMPLSQKELQLRTKMEVMALQAALLRVKLSYQGWLNPARALWDMADMVTVKSPMLFPVEDAKLDLKLFGVTHTQTPEGQTTSAIDLVNLAAFQQRYPDATKSDGFFNVPSSDPQPSPKA